MDKQPRIKKKSLNGAGETGAGIRELFYSARTVFAGNRSSRMFGAVALTLLCGAILLNPMLRGAPLRQGDIAPATIYETKESVFIDKEATDAARESARRAVDKVYRVYPERVESDAREVFDQALLIRDLPENDQERLAATEDLTNDKQLSVDAVDALAALSKEEISDLRKKTIAVMRRTIAGSDRLPEPVINNLDKEVERAAAAPEIGVSEAHIPLIKEIVKSLTWTNAELDRVGTERRRAAAAAAVRPVMKKTLVRAPIVRKGEGISAGQHALLLRLNLLPKRILWARFIGGALLILFIFTAIGSYLKNFSPKVYRDEKKMLIFYIMILFSVLWAWLLSEMGAVSPWFSPYLLATSSGALAILTCIIIEPSVALLVTPLIALCVTIILQFDIGVFFVALMAGFVGCFSTLRRQDLDSIVRAGVAIALSSMLVIAIVTLLRFQSWKQAALDVLLFGAMNGLITAVWSAGVLPLFERTFNIPTSHRLLELSNPENPLLKELLINAPGTYHHCIFVGNLAESAAELVGADSLLVRIASYYHDIGKLKRPSFFTENQLAGVNPTNELNPTLGALVISSHVKDGVEMLHENRVPENITRIASEHHGTCLISIFYQQARSLAKDPNEVSEDRFRYPGPKPTTIESAIVMLADGCEAAVRSLKELTPRSIENQVKAVIKGRIADGQFDDCDVTLSQLEEIRNVYTKILVSVYHTRMEYADIEDDFKHKDKAEPQNGDAKNGGVRRG